LGISPLGSLVVRFHACVLYLTPWSDEVSVATSKVSSYTPVIPYQEAARALLEQHERYTIEDQTEFLATHYPSIPEENR